MSRKTNSGLLACSGIVALCVATWCSTGCFRPVDVKRYDLKPQPHVSEKVKVILDRYVEGMPVASEITLFPAFISDMKEMDPANHELIKQLYQDLQDHPEDAASLAADALEKLVLPEKDTELDDDLKN